MVNDLAEIVSEGSNPREVAVAHHRSLRTELYRDARMLGNVEAAAHGPVSYGRRYARRKIYARTNSFTRSILRSISLSK